MTTGLKLTLSSAIVPKFTLRFAAAGLPTSKEPHRLIIEVQDRRPLKFTDQPLLGPPPPGSTIGTSTAVLVGSSGCVEVWVVNEAHDCLLGSAHSRGDDPIAHVAWRSVLG
jgi:hypothetical protein